MFSWYFSSAYQTAMKQSSEIGLLSLIRWSTGGSHEVLIEEQALVITPFSKKKEKKKERTYANAFLKLCALITADKMSPILQPLVI